MKKEWVLLLGIFVGILAGGLVSELFEMLAPTGMVREFFIRASAGYILRLQGEKESTSMSSSIS